MVKVTALVPMKGNSERVPGKNMRPLCGRPLFEWVLEALAGSVSVGQVVVNTDSGEIAAAVHDRFPDTLILKRPEWLCGDKVPIQPLIEYDLEHTENNLYLQTHATNPLLTSATIDAAIRTFVGQEDHDSLFSVTPLQTRFYWPDGRPVNHDPDVLLPTQDMDPIYEENSCVYVFTREVFDRRKHRLGDQPLMFPMDAEEAVDIDEPIDFVIAEALMEARLQERSA